MKERRQTKGEDKKKEQAEVRKTGQLVGVDASLRVINVRMDVFKITFEPDNAFTRI